MRAKFLILLFISLLVLGCVEESKLSILTPTPTPTPTITPQSFTTPHKKAQHTTPDTIVTIPAFTPTPSSITTPIPTPLETYPTPTPPTPIPFKLEYGVKYKVKVVDVVDGDTIDVIMPDGKEERVRMLGVDTPETAASKNKPYEYGDITDLDCLASWGLKAKQYTESKLEGKYVYIEFDPIAGMRGYYGRLLAYVYYDSTDFTAELVKQGYARVYTEGNFEKESEYVTYQSTAMENNVGLWTCSVEVTPTPTGQLGPEQVQERGHLGQEVSHRSRSELPAFWWFFIRFSKPVELFNFPLYISAHHVDVNPGHLASYLPAHV
jgi:micrococcal nuclease